MCTHQALQRAISDLLAQCHHLTSVSYDYSTSTYVAGYTFCNARMARDLLLGDNSPNNSTFTIWE